MFDTILPCLYLIALLINCDFRRIFLNFSTTYFYSLYFEKQIDLSKISQLFCRIKNINIRHTISGVCNTIHGFLVTFERLNKCPIVCIINLRRFSVNVTKIFRIEINFKYEDVDYQNTVSSGNDELTSIGFECKVVNAAVRKHSRSELTQNKIMM